APRRMNWGSLLIQPSTHIHGSAIPTPVVSPGPAICRKAGRIKLMVWLGVSPYLRAYRNLTTPYPLR
ncbi:MAG: hypothetical protein J7K88_11665, partial [Candidatus Fermentibacteraceae bacterium]|nr:hypothetical protein [Candidatus Fermentibacteraceae bacterium]